MIDRCILHIGTEKTGTTSIQAFLSTNRDILAKSGVLVPKSMGPREHLDLVRAVVDPKKRFGYARRGPGQVELSVEDHSKILKEIHRELSGAKGYKQCVISSERLCVYVQTEKEMEALRSLLLQYFKNIDVYIYLRPQVDLATSRYSTELRKGATRRSVLPVFSATPQQKRVYDYKAILEFWETAFPEAAVKPQIFSSQDLIEGDAVADFRHRTGIKSAAYKEVEVKNISFNAAAQSYLWAVNWLASQGHALNTRKIIRKLHAQFSGKGRLPRRADAIAFMEQFEEANEAIRAKYFPDRAQLFSVDFAKFPEEETPLGVSDADYAAITLAVAGRAPKSRRPRKLTRAILAEFSQRRSLWSRLKRFLVR